MPRGQVPELEQGVLASGKQIAVRCARLVEDHGPRFTVFLHTRHRLDEFQPRDLVLVAAELELADLGDQIPDNDIGVFGATCQADSRPVKGEFRDGRFVAVEVDDDGGDLAVPESNAAILIANGEDVFIGFALGDGSNGYRAAVISPPAQKFALFDIPTQNLLIGGNDGLPGTCARSIRGGPNEVGCVRRDDAERPGVLVLAGL